MKIQAAIVGPGHTPFRLCDAMIEEPRDDEVLVAIKAAGICHTDVVGQSGAFGFDLPAVLGHEGAGVVVRVGSGIDRFTPGDRVAISFRSCGFCPKCDDGHPAYCHSMPQLNYAGTRSDGSRSLNTSSGPLASNFFGQSSFATHALTYERNLVAIPDDIPFEVAAPFGCGVQTGAGSVLNALHCPAGSTLLIAGGGTVGLSAVLGAKIAGCSHIIVVEPHAERRALAIEFGATHTIDAAAENDLARSVRSILPTGVAFALDTTGVPSVLTAMMDALGPQGVLGCVGIPSPGAPPPGELLSIITLGHTICGIIEGDSDPAQFLPYLFDQYLKGRLPIDRMITTYPMADINRAIDDQHAGRCIKAVLSMD